MTVPADIAPHVINISQGRFASDSEVVTTPETVDLLFDGVLTQALADARAAGKPLRLLIHAHGGLVDEASALTRATTHIRWWLLNDVFPLYFVWHTGLLDALEQALGGRLNVMNTGLFAAPLSVAPPNDPASNHAWDSTVEFVSRTFGGQPLWEAMKTDAEIASRPDGAAYYVAQKLAAFTRANPGDVELHALGHSAGAIFLSYFLPATLDLGCAAFEGLYLLAPALRVDQFNARLAPRLGPSQGISGAVLFAMSDAFEHADFCSVGPGLTPYHKSLPYLIYKALERYGPYDLLGLDICFLQYPDLRKLFGDLSSGSIPACGEVIWTPTDVATGRSASAAQHHGDFDDDKATMESIALRVLGLPDGANICPYPSLPPVLIGPAPPAGP